jgi:hypothetical protein
MRQIKPVNTHHPISLISILILSIHLHFGLRSSSFLLVFYQYSTYIPLLAIPDTFSAHPIPLNLVTIIILGEVYKLRNSPLRSFFQLQLSSTSCYLIQFWSKYSLQHPVLKHPQSMFIPLMLETKFHSHKKYRQNYSFVHCNLYLLDSR